MKSYTQLNEVNKHVGKKQVIDLLKDLNVDGDTMQYILHEVGMEEQMLSQLISSDVKQAISTFLYLEIDFLENEDVEKSILEKMKEDSKFYNKIKDFIFQVDTQKYNL